MKEKPLSQEQYKELKKMFKIMMKIHDINMRISFPYKYLWEKNENPKCTNPSGG